MNINLFLKAQEADNCKIKVKQFSIWKGILSVFKIAFPYSILGGGGGTVSLNGRRDQRNNLLPQAFLLGTDPFMICDSWPNCPERPHLLISLHWELSFNMNFEGDAHIQAIAFHPWPLKSMPFSRMKYIHSIPTASKVLTSSSINFKSKSVIQIPSKSDDTQSMIHPNANSSPSISLSTQVRHVLPKHRQSIDIPIPKSNSKQVPGKSKTQECKHCISRLKNAL
jgi:hypothetical protein